MNEIKREVPMIARKKIFWLNFFTMVFIAINLRAPITATGPLVQEIQTHFGLNSTLVGFLTSLPLIAFGVFSFLVARFQPNRAMIAGLFCIIIGEIVRGYSEYIAFLLHIQNAQVIQYIGLCGLFLGTTIMGAGIAVANVLLPSFVKSKFPNQIAQIMGAYSLVLNVSAIIGIAFAIPLAHSLGLLNAMVFWTILAILALILYIPQIKNGRLHKRTQHSSKTLNIFKNASAWKITLFMGIQSFMFYGVVVWLPKIIVEKGYDIHFATSVTLVSQFIAVPVALFGPILLTRLRNKYKPIYMASLCSLYFISLMLLFFCNSPTLLYFIAFLFGMPMGGVFSIALLFVSQKSSSFFISVKLSAMAQGGGYLIASVAPLLMGKLHDIFGGFRQGILIFAFIGLALCIIGLLVYKAEMIIE